MYLDKEDLTLLKELLDGLEDIEEDLYLICRTVEGVFQLYCGKEEIRKFQNGG